VRNVIVSAAAEADIELISEYLAAYSV